MTEDSLNSYCAGFSLSAQRRADGLLHPYHGEAEPIAEFPKTISVFGNTYGLENVYHGANGFEEGQYA